MQDVLTTIVGSIEDGVFPANPGPDGFRPGHGVIPENCRFCEYDRVCPADRGEQWLTIREHPSVGRYRELADPAPVEAEPVEAEA